MNKSGCQHYDNSFFFELNGLLRSLHSLARGILDDLHDDAPLQVGVYGAGTLGWMAVSVMGDYAGLNPVVFVDKSADSLASINPELNIFAPPTLPVVAPEVLDGESLDVILCTSNPTAHEAVSADLDGVCPQVPRYFLNYDDEMECIHCLHKPILLVTASRCGTTWLRRMCRFASFMTGYSEVSPLDRDGLFDYDMPATMLPGQYTVSHHRLTPEIRDLVEEERVIPVFLYRDPRDILVSKYFFSHRASPRAEFRFREGTCREVVDHIAEWTRLPQVMQLRFEDLKTNTAGVFGDFCARVGWDLDAEEIGRIVEATTFLKMSGRAEGQEDGRSHFRKGLIGDWRNHLDCEAQDFVRRTGGELLVELGYERSLNW